MRELLFESLVLGLIGGVVAVGVAYGGLRLLVAIGPADLPRLSEISLDARSLGFTLVLSVFSGLFFGAIPALKICAGKWLGNCRERDADGKREPRASAFAQCAGGGAGGDGAGAAGERGVDDSHFCGASRCGAGVHRSGACANDAHFDSGVAGAGSAVVTRMQNDIRGQAGGDSRSELGGLCEAVPMDGERSELGRDRVEGKSYPGGEPPLRLFNYVSPGYFNAMGTHLVAGRDFTWTEYTSCGRW